MVPPAGASTLWHPAPHGQGGGDATPGNIAEMAGGLSDAQPRARGPRSDAAANRERILEAAVVTVKREGSRVPMSTVARDAGVGIATVYRHFPSREHLMVGLTERSFAFVLANAREAADTPGTGRDALAAFFEATIVDRDQLVLPWHDDGPVVRSTGIAERQAEVWRLIDTILARGVTDGSIGRELTAADAIMFGAMLAQPLPHAPDWDRMARRQARVYLAGIGTEAVTDAS
jgi:AcrR family transcriptional regulator